MTKDTKEINNLRIESEIGQYVARQIYEKAKEAFCFMPSLVHEDRFWLLRSEVQRTIKEICNQPPPIEKEMTAAELMERLKEHYEKSKRYWLSCHSKSGVEFKGINGGALIEYAESLLKQNSEGKE